MLSEEVLDKVIERITNRIEQQNEYILKQIGKSIKEIGTLTPTKAQQLGQILKYGGDYDKIVNKISQITNLNVKDIDKIFKEVAKNDYRFAKQFYDYRGVKYIPFDQNEILQRQVQAISNIMVNNYLSKTKALGFTVKDLNGNLIFKDLKIVYQDAIDNAVFNVSQGKSTFDTEMYKILKEIGESGLKTLDYESGRSVRLDSAIRMNMKDTLRQLNNEEQLLYGKEFDADGVEVSVHLNPAPDHEDVQGKQFSNEQFEKFQNDQDCKSYDGILFSAEHDGHDRRSIGQYNCYHKIFSIVLGVSKPEYTNKQLQEIKQNNNKGFDFDGKHYTNYEGTQLQRQLETEIRKQKDLQILAKQAGNNELIQESQTKITQLTSKYKNLSKSSGLPTKINRMRVSSYKRMKTDI